MSDSNQVSGASTLTSAAYFLRGHGEARTEPAGFSLDRSLADRLKLTVERRADGVSGETLALSSFNSLIAITILLCTAAR